MYTINFVFFHIFDSKNKTFQKPMDFGFLTPKFPKKKKSIEKKPATFSHLPETSEICLPCFGFLHKVGPY